MMTPEQVCAFESMLHGEYLLSEAGIEMFPSLGSIKQASEHLSSDTLRAKIKALRDEIALSPWTFSSAYQNYLRGREKLQLFTAANPLPTADGFSFLPQQGRQRMPSASALSLTQAASSDLRTLSLAEGRQLLINCGVAEEEATQMGRREVNERIRQLAQAATGDPQLAKYARPSVPDVVSTVQRDSCQQLFERQIAAISRTDAGGQTEDLEELVAALEDEFAKEGDLDLDEEKREYDQFEEMRKRTELRQIQAEAAAAAAPPGTAALAGPQPARRTVLKRMVTVRDANGGLIMQKQDITDPAAIERLKAQQRSGKPFNLGLSRRGPMRNEATTQAIADNKRERRRIRDRIKSLQYHSIVNPGSLHTFLKKSGPAKPAPMITATMPDRPPSRLVQEKKRPEPEPIAAPTETVAATAEAEKPSKDDDEETHPLEKKKKHKHKHKHEREHDRKHKRKHKHDKQQHVHKHKHIPRPGEMEEEETKVKKEKIEEEEEEETSEESGRSGNESEEPRAKRSRKAAIEAKRALAKTSGCMLDEETEDIAEATPQPSRRHKLTALRDLLQQAVDAMSSQTRSLPFWYPVRDEQVPDYSKLVKKPIDLTTIRGKIEASVYRNRWEFLADVWRMRENCYAYNTTGILRDRVLYLSADILYETAVHVVLSGPRAAEFDAADDKTYEEYHQEQKAMELERKEQRRSKERKEERARMAAVMSTLPPKKVVIRLKLHAEDSVPIAVPATKARRVVIRLPAVARPQVQALQGGRIKIRKPTPGQSEEDPGARDVAMTDVHPDWRKGTSASS
jgi:hypothetical protein